MMIPIGIVGYSSVQAGACVFGTCFSVSQGLLNYGGGLLYVHQRPRDKWGIHLGSRYTRNYGVGFTFGVVL